MTTRLCPQVGSLRPAAAALAGLLGALLLLAAPPVEAATCGNGIVETPEACDDGGTVAGDGCSATCALEANTCLDDVTGKQAPNNCTANDVQLGLIADVQNSDGCDFPGDTAQVKLQAGLRATSANRWDIGIFIALDGGTARTGACHHNYLPPPLAGLGSYNPGSVGVGNGSGPFYNNEGDTCGDLQQGIDTFYDLRRYPSFTTGDLQTLTIKCVDTDGNGFVDIGSCVSWDNNSNNPVCSSVSQTVPNTKAKCRCETLNTNLAFPGKILVDKITDPNPDPTNTSFNFSLTGGPDSVNVNFSMTNTTPVFGPGPNSGFFKAGTYTLTETEPAGWDLTSIVCVDADNGTTVSVGAGTATIDLDPGQTITCTYTNRNLCAGKVCDDQNTCTTDSCEAGECVFTPTPGAACGDPSDTVCDNPNTCDANGQCQPNYEPATTVCRASAGICDVAESCTGNGADCPADGFKASTTECRASAGICDVAESCTGNGAACPADGFKASTTECRASAGICDVAESCTGNGAECPADGFKASTTECRASAGICDVAESCTGNGAECPADGFKASTTECRASAGICDVAESCTGNGAECPADAFKPATTECRASAGQCDVAESCTGNGAACPADGFAPVTTTCVGTSNGGACDGTDSCDGAGACVDSYQPATTICRASGGQCDVAESCTGSSGACPVDAKQPATTICRPSTGACDVADSCDGTNNACPADAVQPATTICRPSADACDPAESCSGTSKTCGPDVNPAECNEVTDTEYCALPAGSCGGDDGQFRQIFLGDPQPLDANAYRFNATNPGQFYDNVFVSGTPGSSKTLNVTIPYPFVTQGANPIQVHDAFTTQSGCFVPSPSLAGCTITTAGGNLSSSGNPVVVLADYVPQNLGSTTAATVTCTVPASGLLYVTIHLDDGLKKTTGWDRTLADAATRPPVTLNQCQAYPFAVSGDLTDGTTVRSWNEFKKNPGSAGNLSQIVTGKVKPGVKVQLIFGGKVVGTATSDSDGVWQISYKHTGKEASYVVKLPDFGLQQTITLKANGFVIVNFENLP